MSRVSRNVVGALVLLASMAGQAPGQFVPGSFGLGAGSTPQGDILRGEGVFLGGAGLFNYYSAMGNSINADTWMRVNEYLYQSYKSMNIENAQHRAALLARKRENYNQILDRIRNHPEQYDLQRGDALNALFEQLSDPQISPSTFRISSVHLSGDTIRSIPFFYGPEDATISMRRVSARASWPVGLRGDAFAAERRAYDRALDAALDQQIDGKLSRAAILAVEAAVDALVDKLDREIPPSRDKVYIEARNYLKRLEATKELLKRRAIEQILGDIDKYAGTTVHDLIVFMQRNNLRFGIPEIGDERELYPRLYASLRQQLDLVKAGAPVPEK